MPSTEINAVELVNDTSSEPFSEYDRLYEDDDDPELGSMEGHGSVIHHLLSQVSAAEFWKRMGFSLTNASFFPQNIHLNSYTVQANSNAYHPL